VACSATCSRPTWRCCPLALLPNETGERPLLVRQPYMLTERRLVMADVLIHHLDVLRWLFLGEEDAEALEATKP
jgi:hypothetical protein